MDSVVLNHVLFQCIQFPRIQKGRISYLPSVNVRKTRVYYSRPGWNLCGALLGSGGLPFAYPLYDIPCSVPVNGPKFCVDRHTSQEEFANEGFWLYEILYIDIMNIIYIYTCTYMQAHFEVLICAIHC